MRKVFFGMFEEEENMFPYTMCCIIMVISIVSLTLQAFAMDPSIKYMINKCTSFDTSNVTPISPTYITDTPRFRADYVTGAAGCGGKPRPTVQDVYPGDLDPGDYRHTALSAHYRSVRKCLRTDID